MNHLARWTGVAASVGALMALAAPPIASSAPIERMRYSETFAYEFDDCGFNIEVEGTAEGIFMLKAPRGSGAPPYYFDNFEVHETLSANGQTLYLDHQGLYKDLHITLVEGTIYQFVAMEAGQPFVVRDGDGDVIFRDRGVLKYTFQIDTKGDTNIENDVEIEGSFEELAVNGPHPVWDIGDLCPLFQEQLGG